MFFCLSTTARKKSLEYRINCSGFNAPSFTAHCFSCFSCNTLGESCCRCGGGGGGSGGGGGGGGGGCLVALKSQQHASVTQERV